MEIRSLPKEELEDWLEFVSSVFTDTSIHYFRAHWSSRSPSHVPPLHLCIHFIPHYP